MAKGNKKPLLVYLDYNVIVSLQDGDFSVDDIKKMVGTTNVVFPFSPSHIEEVRNINDREGMPRLKAIKERLTFIDALTKKQYIERLRFDIPYKKRSCSSFTVFDTITSVSATEPAYKVFNNIISEEQKQHYRNHLQVDSKSLNNIKTSEIIDHLNSIMIKQPPFKTLSETFQHSRTFLPAWDWGLEKEIVCLFVMLDMVGYWKDTVTETSNVARFWDSSHCTFASYCDVLISNDKRMRLKSEVAYSAFDIKTKILSMA